MALRCKDVRLERRSHVGRACNEHVEVLIFWVSGRVLHQSLLYLVYVVINSWVAIIIVVKVEEAVPRQIVHKSLDSVRLLEIWRELHTISAVKKNIFPPRRVLEGFNFIDGGVLLSLHLNELLTKPLTIRARHRVVINTCEEGHVVVRWMRGRVIQGQEGGCCFITTLVDRQ